jgi:hypothetical protein
MRWAVVLVVAGVAVLGCGGGVVASPSLQSLDPSASMTEPSGEPVVILTEVHVAAEEGAEPIATGVVLEGSSIGGSPFCSGGTILDSHASNDPAVAPLGLIDRMFTCSDGTLRIVDTPEVSAGPPDPQDLIQAGTWLIVSGTGAYEDLRGSGTMETVYDADESAPSHQTLTGSVTR